jgi:hypothetical protein
MVGAMTSTSLPVFLDLVDRGGHRDVLAVIGIRVVGDCARRERHQRLGRRARRRLRGWRLRRGPLRGRLLRRRLLRGRLLGGPLLSMRRGDQSEKRNECDGDEPTAVGIHPCRHGGISSWYRLHCNDYATSASNAAVIMRPSRFI